MKKQKYVINFERYTKAGLIKILYMHIKYLFYYGTPCKF